jgi:hypothetical protein
MLPTRWLDEGAIRTLALGMKARGVRTALVVAIAVAVAPWVFAGMPFDREAINRYSVDGIPRSLSIRQGSDVWLAYDLERGLLFKIWQAPPGKPGLVTTEFTVKSSGTTWFHAPAAASWELVRSGRVVPLKIRYLGCIQREDGFELSWELRHDSGALILRERVPPATAAATDRVRRELRAESLLPGDVLRLPAHEAWNTDGNIGPAWQAITLR